MMFDHYETKEIRAELLGQKGVAIETVRFPDLASLRASRHSRPIREMNQKTPTISSIAMRMRKTGRLQRSSAKA
jgi:hypothetical protein